ncbi:MAG TPA: GntR family transcriptional regulator [Bryobacteraceae bacterium]|jgi:GntR family transcriptional regulator
MLFRLNASSGVPLYVQLMEQIKHAVETGALRPGDQLPTIRALAQELVMNSNTVVRAYRELEHEGIVELRHGLGAFISSSVSAKSKVMRQAQHVVESAIERLSSLGVTQQEMRRLFESELSAMEAGSLSGRKE